MQRGMKDEGGPFKTLDTELTAQAICFPLSIIVVLSLRSQGHSPVEILRGTLFVTSLGPKNPENFAEFPSIFDDRLKAKQSRALGAKRVWRSVSELRFGARAQVNAPDAIFWRFRSPQVLQQIAVCCTIMRLSASRASIQGVQALLTVCTLPSLLGKMDHTLRGRCRVSS